MLNMCLDRILNDKVPLLRTSMFRNITKLRGIGEPILALAISRGEIVISPPQSFLQNISETARFLLMMLRLLLHFEQVPIEYVK